MNYWNHLEILPSLINRLNFSYEIICLIILRKCQLGLGIIQESQLDNQGSIQE